MISTNRCRWAKLGALFFGLVLPEVVLASDAMAGLQELMRCQREPQPTQVLRDLLDARLLTGREGPGLDDEYCWSLARALRWDGAEFTLLCAVTGDAAEIASNPELYWQGPTHSPFTEVWLVSAVSDGQLARWAAEALPADSRFEIDPPGGSDDQAVLSCSAWHFPLPG